jgi:integrase
MTRRKYSEKKHNSHRLAKSRFPGVFHMEGGGVFVRARVQDPWKPKVSGKKWSRLKTIKRIFRDKTDEEAFEWLQAERRAIRSRPSVTRHELLFARFSHSVLHDKATLRELSADKVADWKNHLRHLIEGTSSSDKSFYVPGFGDRLVTEITTAEILQWKKDIARLVFEMGEFKPGTTNGWLSTLKVIIRAAKTKYGLKHDVTEGVKQFSMAEHSTYSFEEPNSLTLEQLSAFLGEMKERYPQHWALTRLGFATGIRCVNLSPLRRRKDADGSQDVYWDGEWVGRCFIRRGYQRSGQMRQTTKQRESYPITLPESLLDDLRWHVETQLAPGPQRDSIYLFANENGEPRQSQVLTKPFEEVSAAIGLPYTLSLRGMRRTFNWMMETAGVDAKVTRSITGHKTAKMQDHYTFKDAQMHRHAIGSAIAMIDGRWSSDEPRAA